MKNRAPKYVSVDRQRVLVHRPPYAEYIVRGQASIHPALPSPGRCLYTLQVVKVL